MKRILTALLTLIILASVISCERERDEGDEIEFERVIAPASDVPEFQETNEPPTVDLAPLLDAVQANPDDPDARLRYLSGLRIAGNTREALEQARILADMEGAELYKSVAWLNFAEIVLDEIPEDAPDRNDLLQEAMDGMWIALGWEPESIPAHRVMGRLALETGDEDRALHHLAIALSAVEIGYELRVRMAKIYIERDDFEKARAHLEAALDLAEQAEDSRAVREINRLMGTLH